MFGFLKSPAASEHVTLQAALSAAHPSSWHLTIPPSVDEFEPKGEFNSEDE
jgi:hypothetical protein